MPYSSSLHFPNVSDSLTRLSVWKSHPFLLFQVLFFLFSNTQSCCEVFLRSWKVLFKPEVFAVFTFQLARWISVGQSIERKGFWQDFWRPTSSSCLSLLQFSHNWLSRVAAKKTPYQMQTEKSKSFKIHQWGPCGDAALLRFFTTFEKWEIGAFSFVLSELLTISSCSVCAERRCHEDMTWSRLDFLRCNLSDLILCCMGFICCIFYGKRYIAVRKSGKWCLRLCTKQTSLIHKNQKWVKHHSNHCINQYKCPNSLFLFHKGVSCFL